MNSGRYMVGLVLALCCSLFVSAPRCDAQNLVPNPSFELRDTCPYSVGFQEGDRPLYWYSWLNTPDYFNACAGSLQSIDSLVDVPRNGWTFQYAWEGNAYVGMYAYDGVAGDYREYVGAELIQPLVVGCTYLLRFRINPADNGTYWLIDGGSACSNMGLLLATSSNAWTAPEPWPPGPDFPFRNYAQLKAEVPIGDTATWTSVEGTFVADSAYTHLVLGNFFPDSLTTAIPLDAADPWYGITYYLIDGVEVIPLDSGCNGLGVPDAMSANAPSVQWAEDRIEVYWDGEVYSVQVMDSLGRTVWETESVITDLDLPKPMTEGVYYLRLLGKEKQHIVKFEVW